MHCVGVCIGIWKVEELFWTIPQRIFSVFYARPNPDQTARMIVDIAQHKNSLKQRNYYFSVQFVITIRNIRLLISTKQKRPSSSDESVSVIKMNFKWHWLSWLFVSLLWNKTTLKLVWPTSDFVFIIADRQVIRNRKFTFWWTALFREARKMISIYNEKLVITAGIFCATMVFGMLPIQVIYSWVSSKQIRNN